MSVYSQMEECGAKAKFLRCKDIRSEEIRSVDMRSNQLGADADIYEQIRSVDMRSNEISSSRVAAGGVGPGAASGALFCDKIRCDEIRSHTLCAGDLRSNQILSGPDEIRCQEIRKVLFTTPGGEVQKSIWPYTPSLYRGSLDVQCM
jgi:hypothetical protein